MSSYHLYLQQHHFSGKMVVYYHYTTEAGAQAINKNKIIFQSALEGPDAVLGEGCYFTTMDPTTHTQEQIAKDNWTTAWQSAIRFHFCFVCLSCGVQSLKAKFIYPPHLNPSMYSNTKVLGGM